MQAPGIGDARQDPAYSKKEMLKVFNFHIPALINGIAVHDSMATVSKKSASLWAMPKTLTIFTSSTKILHLL